MRAWQVMGTGEPEDVLRCGDKPAPDPRPGMVAIDVAAAAIGLPDVLMCRGTYPLTPAHPFTPGQEVAGVVSRVGEGVSEALVGRRVMAVTAFTSGDGGFAEHTLAPAANVFDVPDDMADHDAAGFFIAFHTAWIGLARRGRLVPGERVLVLGGSGGSGAAAIQVARSLGAEVIAVAGSQDKIEFCATLGADATIDRYATDDLTGAIREHTDGHGIDVVYDPVGGPAAAAAQRALANEGRHLVVGFASGDWAPAESAGVVFGNYDLVGVYAGAYDRAQREVFHRELTTRWSVGDFVEIVSYTHRFDDLPHALTAVADRIPTR